MAITAETRNSIIELVVTAYNAPPGTTLLTELVAIVDGGGTLADVATALTTSDTWNGLYPSFQTAEEFAAEWLGNLVPEASEDALAGGIEIAVGLINGGSSFADVILVAQDFLANLAEDDAEFGSSAANFNNKVEVATYHTITLEQDADDIGDLQNVLANVTSDDDSVADAQNDAAAAVPGETVSLTTGLDTGAAFTTGSTNDVFSAVDADNAEIDTLTTGDSLNGGLGTDTLSLAISGSATASASSVSTTNIENVKIYNNSDSAYSLDASLMDGITDVFVNAGTSATSVETGDIVNLHLVNTTQNATLDAGTAVSGSADDAIILASGANDGAIVTSLTATYNGLETVNLVSTGSANEVTLSVNSLETLNVSGETDIAVVASFDGVSTDASTATFDASAAGGDVSAYLTAEGGVTSVTMGAGDDTINFRSTIDGEVTIAGGEGTDTLQLGYLSNVGAPTAGEDITFDAEAEAAEAAGLNVSGIEALQLWSTDVDGRALSGNAESSITSLTAFGSSAVTYMPIASITHISSGTVTLGDAEAEVAGAGGDVTALTLTQADVLGNGAVATTLVADEIESLTILNAGEAEFTVTMSEDGSASLTSAIIAGTGKQTVDIAGDALATVNAAGVTGSETFTLTADGGADVTVTASSVRPDNTDTGTANDITTGEGADTITASDYNDIIDAAGGDNYVMAGAGDDAVDAGEGADTISGGAGDDTIAAGEGDNVVTGEAGDDVITSGDDDDSLTGGAGDDTLTSTKGDDTIDGGAGEDVIDGGRGDDLITGGEGDDVITTGSGADTVDAGGDDDFIIVSGIDSEDVIDGGEGVDSMAGGTPSKTATYQANAIFTDVEAEGAELALPGIEALWLDAKTAAEGTTIDFSGAPDLATVYLDVQGAAIAPGGGASAEIEAEGAVMTAENDLHLKDLAATTLNLRTFGDIATDGTNDIVISGDDQDLTINMIAMNHTSNGAELDFDPDEYNLAISDVSSATINFDIKNAEGDFLGEGEVGGLDEFGLEGSITISDASSLTINVDSTGTNESGETAAEAGTDFIIGGGIISNSEELTSITVSAGDDIEVSLEGANGVGIDVSNGGEAADDIAINLTIGDDAYMYVGDINAIGTDGTTVDINIGVNSEFYAEDMMLGKDAAVNVVMGAGSYFELEDITGGGSELGGAEDDNLDGTDVELDITASFGSEIYLEGEIGDGEHASITISGLGSIGGGGSDTFSSSVKKSFTVDVSDFADDGGTVGTLTVDAAEAASITIKTDLDVYDAVEDISRDGGFDAGESTTSIFTGNADVTSTHGESDDTITTSGGDDVIDAGNGENVISAGGGEDDITTGTGDDDITLGDGDDTVDAGAGDDTIDAAGGSDTITINTGDSAFATATAFDTIVDLDVGATESDTIDLGDSVAEGAGGYTAGVTVVGDVAVGVDVALAAEGADAVDAGDVLATVADGIMTLAADTDGAGTAVDLAAFDELDEYVAAALIVLAANDETTGDATDVDELTIGFVFDGDTYVISVLDAADADDAALTVDTLVQLTGLAGDETLGTAAAADTIVVG